MKKATGGGRGAGTPGPTPRWQAAGAPEGLAASPAAAVPSRQHRGRAHRGQLRVPGGHFPSLEGGGAGGEWGGQGPA